MNVGTLKIFSEFIFIDLIIKALPFSLPVRAYNK